MLQVSSTIEDLFGDETITFSPMESEPPVVSETPVELPSTLQTYVETFLIENNAQCSAISSLNASLVSMQNQIEQQNATIQVMENMLATANFLIIQLNEELNSVKNIIHNQAIIFNKVIVDTQGDTWVQVGK